MLTSTTHEFVQKWKTAHAKDLCVLGDWYKPSERVLADVAALCNDPRTVVGKTGLTLPLDTPHDQDHSPFTDGDTCARGPYSVAQAAKILGLSVTTVRRMCNRTRTGETALLSERTRGNHRRISAAEIDEFVKRKVARLK